MIPHSTRTTAVLVLALLLMTASPSAALAAENQTPDDKTDSIPWETRFGVSYRVTEQAHDGERGVDPAKTVKVDANADLLLEFKVLTTEEVAEESPAWKGLNKLLLETKQLMSEWARLNAVEVDLENAAEVQALWDQVNALDNKVVEYSENLAGWLGKTEKEVNKITFGEFNGGTRDPGRPYENITLWIKQELNRLRSDADDLVERREKIDVLVQAYHDPLNGERKWLHVEGYDQLPAGQLQPIPRFTLQMSPAEQRQLNMAAKMNGQAAKMLREIGTSGDEIEKNIQAQIEKLKNYVDKLADKLETEFKTWTGGLDAVVKKLTEKAAGETDPKKKKDYTDIATELTNYQKEYDQIKTAITGIRDLKVDLADAKFADLATALMGQGGVLERIGNLTDTLGSLEKTLKGWSTRAIKVGGLAKARAEDLGKELTEKILPESLERGLQSLATDFPETVKTIDTVKEYLGSMARVQKGNATLDSIDEDKTIWHSAGDAPDTVIELARVGWLPGERVTVLVRFRKKNADADAHQERYRVEAEMMGLHRKIRSNLIFARADTGDAEATKWKPNVAALATWHFHKRDPKKFGKAWNRFGPGFGIHLASLDQGDDSVEFGVGPSLVFVDGLVSIGYGYNLSTPTNQEYYFLGVDLFDVLNKAKGGKGVGDVPAD